MVLNINEARPRSAHARLDTSVVRAARQAARALGTFQGVKRRFELVGEVPGLRVYDDYAHHPTEVRATLQAARQKFPQKEIWVVFQPHTYRCELPSLCGLCISSGCGCGLQNRSVTCSKIASDLGPFCIEFVIVSSFLMVTQKGTDCLFRLGCSRCSSAVGC